MHALSTRPLEAKDGPAFLKAMQESQSLHHPWVKPPTTVQQFQDYLVKYQQANNRSYIVLDVHENIVGVYNLNDIVQGVFQSAYLGYFAVLKAAQQGYMSAGLKLILKEAFTNLGLHRLEANIQPNNQRSIYLVAKNGFRKEGYSPRYLYVDGEWRDHERWAITYEDWLSLSNHKNE